MRILMMMKLADINLYNHVFPLASLDGVEEIMIVRDTKGPELNKVNYFCPPAWAIKFLPFNMVFKFVLGLKLSLEKKPGFILGYLFFPHGLMAFIIAKFSRRKVGINLIAGPVEFYGTGSPINQFPYTKPLPELSWYGRIVRIIIQSSDVIIVGGSYSRSFLERNGFDSTKIHVLHKPMEAQLPQDPIKKQIDVLYLGRLSKVKHVDTIIRSIYIVKKHMPAINVAIVGDGSEYEKLVRLAESLELSDNVTFYGWQNDPWKWINRSRISVLTSEREGLPQSVMQSLYCGVPVISTDCGDISDIVKSGVNGYVIQNFDDVESLASSIEHLLQHPDQLRAFSYNAYTNVREQCSVEGTCSAWREILGHISME